MPLRIANGAGFLGDNLDAPRLLVERARVDYLTLEYLAELTMSILARLREKDPQAGYAADFITVLESLVPALRDQPGLKIVTNAGGVNPLACARAAAKVLASAGLAEIAIGVVTGDDLLPRIPQLEADGWPFENLDTGQTLAELSQPIVSANAYLGARPVAEALARGARVVITGRVADAALTVGPAMYELKRPWNDWKFLAGASVAGHLIECGAQATGGLYRHWEGLKLVDVGYPIAELEPSGECVITKPAGTGGAVNRHTVAEQLVYEIGDPAHYLTPDVDVDFTAVELDEIAADRVRVRGATGRAAPDRYKVSLAYAAGYMASGQLLVVGRDAEAKARACGQMILDRVARAGFTLEETLVECLGTGQAAGQEAGVRGQGAPQTEIMLRVTARDARREAVERFTKQFAPLITSGPPGLAGYAAGRPQVRSVFAYWPTLVAKRLVDDGVKVDVRPAAAWSIKR